MNEELLKHQIDIHEKRINLLINSIQTVVIKLKYKEGER